MKKIIKGIKILGVLCLAFALATCADDDDATSASLEALFTHTINQETGTVTFINVSSNADSFSWDLGDGTTSNLINPVKTYESGTYVIVLTATNSQGASDTYEDTIYIQVPEPITLPISFDNPAVSYDATAFGGVSFSVVENPDPSGANSDVSNVGAITNIGAAFEGFFFDLGTPIDLTEDKSIKLKFWSTTSINVLLKLEEGTGADVESVTTHGGTGWEEIYFTFNSAASYSRFTLFVDGPGTTSGTFYLDDVEQINAGDVPCLQTALEFPIDFDCNGIDYNSKIVGNVDFSVVDNPELSGINNEDTKVGRITNSGEQFENAFFNLDTPADFSSQTGIRMKLFSDQALPVLLKFEDGTQADVEDTQMHSGTGWEELTFTLNSTGSYNDMVLFIDGPGTAAGTFYVDDITQVDGAPPPPPFDDGLLTNGDFQTLDSNGNVTEWIQGVDDNNPAPVVTVSGNTYYSINITTPTPGSPLNINLSQKVEIIANETYILSFVAWSNVNRSVVAGIGLSEPDFNSVSETVNITTTPTVYQRTFTADGFGAPNARVLFDLAEEAGMVNIDNVSLFVSGGGGGGGCTGNAVAATSLPVNFEGCESFISTFSSMDPGGVTASLADNPNPSGINNSASVLRVVRASGINRWGGVQNSFPPGTIDITTNTFKVKVYSSIPNVTYRFELALDPQPNPVVGNPAPQFRQVNGGANQWVELEFTFTNLPATPTTYNQLVIKPDNPEGTDPQVISQEQIFYFDDIRLD
ncbi:PKD domain-containing protein [Paucihalobacter sp.]|uniref:PKD domain-containing protein n=1 Tax=Paucihalobacter sp. TaxID=2850405 RepID=UPI002FDF7D24